MKGITINPNIPSDWKEYKASRVFRGKEINLVVKNPNGKNNGISEFIINGKKSESNFIDVSLYSEEKLNVEITLG